MFTKQEPVTLSASIQTDLASKEFIIGKKFYRILSHYLVE